MKLFVRSAQPSDAVVTGAGVRVRAAVRAGAIVLVAAAVTAAGAAFGPMALAGQQAVQAGADEEIAGTVPLFDTTKAHTFSLTFVDADYQKMLDTYFATKEKEWIKANVVIDGTTIPEVGIRLKGNSTLMSLTRNGQRPGGATGGMGWAQLKAEEPETLPWLVRFDKFVEDRRYQGYKAVSVRTSGAGTAVTLNEAVALTLLKQTGDPYQKFSYSTVTVNNRPAKLRLLLEDPSAKFSKEIGPNGVLYKSVNTAKFSYQGTDLTAYEDDFKQITKEDSQTLQPVVDLVKWVTESTDAEFQANFAKYVDLPSFARYVAYQNLVLNWDDMAGPGKNYFLWYDLDAKKSTIVTSDLNLTFSSKATIGPCEKVSMGGFGGSQLADPLALSLLEQQATASPGAAATSPDAAAAAPPGGGFSFGGHPLKDRFLKLAAFREAYANAYRTMYRQFYADGGATKAVDSMVSVLSGISSANKTTVNSEANTLRTTIQSRTTSLANNALIKGGTCS